MLDPLASPLLGPLFASPVMRGLLADRERLQRMLEVEAALARAEAATGVIPQQAVAAIAAACRAEHYDLAALGDAAVNAGNVAIPLVKALTAQVGKTDKEAARYVHWGATSQDILDTALALDLRAAIDALVADLDRAVAGFAALAERHRNVPAAGRTWLQQALPIPLGLKLAGYAGALGRSRDRLKRLRGEALVLQLGGAAGTLAALEDKGLQVAERMAAELELTLPDAPWHSFRDRLAEVAAALAILAGTCGKIARDVTLLMQTEVAEAFEPAAEGRGGSSTMPQKRNPVGAVAALSAATIASNLAGAILNAQVHEHERATGTWQAEWPIYPALALVTSGALHAVANIAEGLIIDQERMRQNLDATGGQIMAEAVTFALARKLGKQEAHHLIEAAAKKALKEKRHLKDALKADAGVTQHLGPAEIDALFDPLAYQGVAQAFIDRLIGSTKS